MPTVAHRWSMLLALAAASSCRNDAVIAEVEKPAAPQMQALLDAYSMPTGALTAATLLEVVAGIPPRIASVDAIQLDHRVIDAAQAALRQLQDRQAMVVAPQAPLRKGVAVAAEPLTVEGQGYLEVTRICDGWGAFPVPDWNNGFMQLTVGFTEQGVDPVIWGGLTLCKYRLGEHQIQLDGVALDPNSGDVRVYVGSNVQLATFGTFPDPVLVELLAQVFVDGVEVAGQLSFRIDVNTRGIELLVPVTGGNVLAAIDGTRANLVQVRAANGLFQCDLAVSRCTAPDGTTFGAP
jgi:hypothetical protein